MTQLVHDHPDMPHGLYDVARAGLSLGAYHGRAFGNAPQRLAEIARAADERNGEIMLVQMITVVRRREHFALVDVIHAERLQNPCFGHVAYAHLGHDGYAHRLHDAFDHGRVRHARHASGPAYVRRNALQRHDGAGACPLGNDGLLGRGHIHDDAALQHFRKPRLQSNRSFFHNELLLPAIFRKDAITPQTGRNLFRN